MAYAPAWTNADPTGRLLPGTHAVAVSDAAELFEAVNRRRRLVYLAAQDFASQVGSGKPVRRAALDTQQAPPFANFRDALVEEILSPAVGGLGGDPATPAEMRWLWPVAGDDENSPIVATDPQAGEVGLFDELNGTDDWTDPSLTAYVSAVRAVHFNELRQAVEWLSRGRWRLPVYLAGGLISTLPDTPWLGGAVANNGVDELRTTGFVLARTLDDPPLGLTGVTVRTSTGLTMTADADCRIAVYRGLRAVDFLADPPTWNQYDPSESADWAQAGGIGTGDATFVGEVELLSGQPGELSGAALAAAVQAMIDGAEQTFLLRRADTGYATIAIDPIELTVEFDLDTPPN